MPDLEPYRDAPEPELPDRLMRWIEVLRQTLKPVPDFFIGDGSPEGVVTAPLAARYFDRATVGNSTWGVSWGSSWGASWGASPTGDRLYFKTTAGGNTGWIAYG